jgi:hypothetical protein
MSQSPTQDQADGLQGVSSRSEWFDAPTIHTARTTFREVPSETPESWAAYAILYLEERYGWAQRLLDSVADLNLDHDRLSPAARRAWDAACTQMNGGDDFEPTPLQRRAGVVQALGVLAEAPGICQGLAAAMRTTLIKYDREAWEAM